MDDRTVRKLQKAREDILSGNFKEISFPETPEGVVELRKRLKLTQRQFAERLHVSIDTVKSWESGRRKPGRQSKLIADMALN